MKKLIVLILVLIASIASAATVSFTAGTGGGEVKGYNVYYTDKTAGTDHVIDVGNSLSNEINLWPGHEYDFWVKAYNDAGESPATAIVSHTAKVYTSESNVQIILIIKPGSPSMPVINE